MNFGPKVKKYCAEHNIVLDDNDWPGFYDLCVTTPAGFVLKSVGDHSAVTHMPKDSYSKQDAWKEVWEDLSLGLEHCTIPDCEFCDPPVE